MRLCRYSRDGRIEVGLYDEKFIVPVTAAATASANATHERLDRLDSDDLLAFLPPDGKHFAAAKKVAEWAARNDGGVAANMRLAHEAVELLVPIPRPNKLLLLAGNYNEHLQEGGGASTERAETFPYLFWKPSSTTLTGSYKPVVIPKVSPDHIDWELELCIVIGRRARHVSE